MATIRPGEGTGKRITTAKGARDLPFEDHVLDLRNVEPDIFETWDRSAIADRLMERMYPPSVPHRNVIRELMFMNLGTFRRNYDPNWEVSPRTPTVIVRVPKPGDLAEAFIFGQFRPDRRMRDGRLLAEWTIGELRAESKGMQLLIEKFADLDDDELVGDHLS